MAMDFVPPAKIQYDKFVRLYPVNFLTGKNTGRNIIGSSLQYAITIICSKFFIYLLEVIQSDAEQKTVRKFWEKLLDIGFQCRFS